MLSGYKDVKFFSSGIPCSAWLFEPVHKNLEAKNGAPCIVMANGFALTKKDKLKPFAEKFQQSGFFALAFDYRFLGDSGGMPRQLISNPKQLEDWDRAIEYAKTIPGVDPQRIILWGASYSGGHVIIAAVYHKDIFGVVSLVGIMDGLTITLGTLKDIGLFFRLIISGFWDGLFGIFGKSQPIPVASRPGNLAAETKPGAWEGYQSIVSPSWINLFCPRFVLYLWAHRPVLYAKNIKCPTLIQIAEYDKQAPPEDAKRCAKVMGANGISKWYPVDHFQVFTGKTQKSVADDQIAFLIQLINGSHAKKD